MDYWGSNEQINNRKAREITHIRADYQMKAVFGRMVTSGLIEQVPGTRTSSTAYRKVIVPATTPPPSNLFEGIDSDTQSS